MDNLSYAVDFENLAELIRREAGPRRRCERCKAILRHGHEDVYCAPCLQHIEKTHEGAPRKICATPGCGRMVANDTYARCRRCVNLRSKEIRKSRAVVAPDMSKRAVYYRGWREKRKELRAAERAAGLRRCLNAGMGCMGRVPKTSAFGYCPKCLEERCTNAITARHAPTPCNAAASMEARA